MALLRALIAGPAPLSRRALSIEFCRRVGWLKPDGGLKDMMARVTMLAMHRDGLIELRRPDGSGAGPSPSSSDPTPNRRCSPRPRLSTRFVRSRCAPSCTALVRVGSGTSSSPATTTSDTRPSLAPRCVYAVHDRNGSPVAMLGFSTAPGSSPRATTSSDGRPSCARRTCRSWSTIRGS